MIIVDVSDNNPPDQHPVELKWAQAVKAGLVALIIKYTQGVSRVDPSAMLHHHLAYAGGVRLFGGYHFGVSKGTPESQASLFLKSLQRDFPDLTGVRTMLDIESYGASTMSVKAGETFIQEVQKATGKWPILYMGRYGPSGKGAGLPSKVLSQCDLMLPAYGPHHSNLGSILPKGFRMPKNNLETGGVVRLWQFTDGTTNGGPFPGLGRVDQSQPIGFNDLGEFTHWWRS